MTKSIYTNKSRTVIGIEEGFNKKNPTLSKTGFAFFKKNK